MMRFVIVVALLVLASTTPALPQELRGPAQAPAVAVLQDVFLYKTRAGEDLPAIARQWFIDPENWRALQALNRIADPLKIAEGTNLRVRRSWLRQIAIDARVVAFRGAVDVVRSGRTHPVEVGTSLREGDLLRTGGDGYATLGLPDGSRVSLPSASRIRIARLRRLPMSHEVDRRFVLESGHVDAKVTPMTNSHSEFLIRTPVAVAAVRGTRFHISYTPSDQLMTTEVTEGRVLLQRVNGAEEVLLLAGFGAVATAEGLSPAIRLMQPPVVLSPNLIQQEETVSFRLQKVSRVTGYVVEIASDAEFTNRIARVNVCEPAARFAAVPAGEYHVRAAAVDEYGLIGNSARFAFARHAPPALQDKAAENNAKILGLQEVIAAAHPVSGLADWFGETTADVASLASAALGGDAGLTDTAADETAIAQAIALQTFAADEQLDLFRRAVAFGQTDFRRLPDRPGSGSTSGGSGGSGSWQPGGGGPSGGSSGPKPDSGLTIIPTDPNPPSPVLPGTDPDGYPGDLNEGGSSSGGNMGIITAIPEPDAWMLMIAGFAAIGWMLRRRIAMQAA